MKCENLQLNLPVYLDDILRDDERALLEEHLARCPLCRQKLADFQALRLQLRGLARPEMPDDVKALIRSRVAQEVKSSQTSIFTESFREWLQMRLMPYSVGTALSLLLGVTLLWTLLSAANFSGEPAELAYQPVKQTTARLTNSNAYPNSNEFELNPADFAAARLSVSGDSPSVNPQGALVALTKSFVRGKMKDDEVVVVADVFGNGLAQISEVIEPSRDRQAVRELQQALKTNPEFAPPFVPATLDRRSDNVRVVLRIQRVDVQTY